MEILVMTALSALLLVAVLIDHCLHGMAKVRPIHVLARQQKAERHRRAQQAAGKL